MAVPVYVGQGCRVGEVSFADLRELGLERAVAIAQEYSSDPQAIDRDDVGAAIFIDIPGCEADRTDACETEKNVDGLSFLEEADSIVNVHDCADTRVKYNQVWFAILFKVGDGDRLRKLNAEGEIWLKDGRAKRARTIPDQADDSAAARDIRVWYDSGY